MLEMEFDDASTAFGESDASWIVQDVSLLGNLHTIDSALANSYASHVLKGNPLHLHYVSVVTTRHIAPGPSFTINLVRGFTRLRQIFWTYVSANGAKSRDFKGPNNVNYDLALDNYQWMVTIGSRKFPERPSEGVSEAFMRLRQASATSYGKDDMSITPANYMKSSAGCQFIQGLDLEKCGAHGATHSGISTKDGSIVQLEVKNSPCDAAGTDFVIIHLVYDGLMSIRDGSVDVFE